MNIYKKIMLSAMIATMTCFMSSCVVVAHDHPHHQWHHGHGGAHEEVIIR
jgi:hypothetical protein